MNILICGGEKSNAIANAMTSRLGPSGIDFSVVSNISEIADLATKGQFFDRMVIFQKGIVDFDNYDEFEVRNIVNTFAENMRYSGDINDRVFVFVALDEQFASIISDEILSISNNSVVLVKPMAERGYTVRFIELLMTSELGYFPENLVYVPQIEEFESEESGVEIEDVNFGFDDMGSFDEVDETKNNETEFTPVEDEFKPVPGGDFDIDASTPGFNFDELDNLDLPGETEEAQHSSNYMPVDDIEQTQETGQSNDFDTIQDDFDAIQDDFEFEHSDDSTNTQKTENNDQFNYGGDTFTPNFETEYQTTPKYEPEQTYEPAQPVIDPSMYETPEKANEEFSDNMYNTKKDADIKEDDYEEPEEQYEAPKANNAKSVKAAFSAFANRGISLFVTGCGGCGTSTLAMNMANALVNLGYSVLVVDMDTVHKSQSFITKDNYMAVDHSGAAVMAAVNSSSPVSAYMAIAKQGLHVLTMGLASDTIEPKSAFTETKVARFNQAARMGHNFVIYDVPFNYISQGLDQLAIQADNIILNIDSSNWGITKTLVDMCNIENPDLAEVMFTRSQLVFNRFKGLNKVFGKNVKKPYDITKLMDKKMLELNGTDIGYRFSDLPISGIIKFDKMYDECWYEGKQYTDTNKGYNEYIGLITDIVVRA